MISFKILPFLIKQIVLIVFSVFVCWSDIINLGYFRNFKLCGNLLFLVLDSLTFFMMFYFWLWRLLLLRLWIPRSLWQRQRVGLWGALNKDRGIYHISILVNRSLDCCLLSPKTCVTLFCRLKLIWNNLNSVITRRNLPRVFASTNLSLVLWLLWRLLFISLLFLKGWTRKNDVLQGSYFLAVFWPILELTLLIEFRRWLTGFLL